MASTFIHPTSVVHQHLFPLQLANIWIQTRKKRHENLERDDGNKDLYRSSKNNMSRCGKRKYENERTETERLGHAERKTEEDVIRTWSGHRKIEEAQNLGGEMFYGGGGGKYMILHSAASSPLDHSKRRCNYAWRPIMHSHFHHQVLICPAESTGVRLRERKCPNFETIAKGDLNHGSLDCECSILPPLSYRAAQQNRHEGDRSTEGRNTRLQFSDPHFWSLLLERYISVIRLLIDSMST